MKRLLLVLLIIAWCLPAAIAARTYWWQLRTDSVEIPSGLFNPRLEGVVANQAQPRFTWAGFWNGTFQKQSETWFAESFGLRGWFIRINNQIAYSVFGVSRQRNDRVVVGQFEQLYELPYLRDACHMKQPLPTARLNELAERIARVQSLFESRHVRFITVITPQKASIYPEFMPLAFRNNMGTAERDYDAIVPLLRRHGVTLVDGHELTLQAKSKFDYPLFCQGSTHWNDLGAFPTARAVVPLLNQQDSKSPASVSLGKIATTNRASGSEADLVAFMNVLAPPRHYVVPLPEIRTSGALGEKTKQTLVIVGGSFVDKLYRIWGGSGLFSRVDWYRYYIEGIWRFPSENGRKFDVDTFPWKKVFLKADAVVLEINESNFHGGHITRFLDDALHHMSDEASIAP